MRASMTAWLGPSVVAILLAAVAAVHVREDVAGPEVLREQLVDRPYAGAAEIDHHRDVGDLADFHGARKRLPFRTGIVRALDADDEPLVLQRHVGGRLDFLSVRSCSYFPPELPRPTMLMSARIACSRRIDDALLHVLEVAPSRPAGIDERRHAGPEAEPVGISPRCSSAPELDADRGPVDVGVQIDETGCHVQPGDVHRLERARGRNVGGHGGDLSVLDRHVPHRAQLVAGVDDVSSLEEEVVVLGESRARQHRETQ